MNEVGGRRSFEEKIARDIPLSITTTASPLKYVWILLHLVACGVYIAGLVLRMGLHTSEECEMTYSRRQLVPISALQHSKYSLHKFVDQRDPRHRALLKEWMTVVQAVGDEEQKATVAYLQAANPRPPHCSENSTTTVLYIPGHWGSYMQSRSIGAHGIQLTGARDHQQAQAAIKALTNNEWKGQSLDEFQFDVYAVNFQEEGAALHAQLLWEQAAFVAKAVKELRETCQLQRLVLLGHSIGGYVARMVPKLYPEIPIDNIITLGSPHAHPVFGWESTLYQLHKDYLQGPSETALVAISGGLRDEMIPPVACNANLYQVTNSLSVLSPEIMKKKESQSPQLGMDHRAIVWCHNLLSVVREVIYTLETNQSLPPQERLNAVQSNLRVDGNYDASLLKHQETFREIYGSISSMAMEAAMLYHLELLVGLFVFLGCFHSIDTSFVGQPLTPLMTTICIVAKTNYQIHVLGLLVLTLVANTAFFLLQWMLRFVGSCLYATPTLEKLRRVRFLTTGTWFLVLGLLCVGKFFGWPARICLAFLFAVYVGTLGTAVAIVEEEPQSTTTPLATTFSLLCPFLVAGKIVALLAVKDPASNLPEEYWPDRGLLMLSLKLLLPMALRMLFHHCLFSKRAQAEETMRAVVLTLSIIFWGLSLFQIGQGYQAGDLLATVCWAECLFLPLI